MKKEFKNFNLFKAIRESALHGQLTGLEKELSDEGHSENRAAGVQSIDYAIVLPQELLKVRSLANVSTSNAAIFPTLAGEDINTVATPNILEKLGVKIYDQLDGNLILPVQSELTSTFVDEMDPIDSGGGTFNSITLQPRRVGGGDLYTKELFRQFSPALQESVLNRFLDSVWRAIQKDLFQAIGNNATVLTGHTKTDAVAALTWPFLLAMESEIECSDNVMSYLMSSGQRSKLKALQVGGSGSSRYAWQSNFVNGYQALASKSMKDTNGGQTNTAFDILFGDFSAACVGVWGNIELLVNPVTYAEQGAYEIIVNALTDTTLLNPSAISAIRNADI